MKHIYLFNSSVRGTDYGVGTYLRQLIDTLSPTRYALTVVYIRYEDKEFDIVNKAGVRYIFLSAPVLSKKDSNYNAFEKSIPIMLYPYIDKSEKNIFHLNYMGNKYLAEYLRIWIGGAIVLTVHYTDWSFSLLGNRAKLRRMLKKEEKELDKPSRLVVENLAQEKDMLEFCDKIVAISRHSYEDLIKIHKADKHKIRLINNALRDTYIKKEEKKSLIRKKLRIPPDDIVLVFAGRLDPVKGLDLLIEAFKRTVEKYPAARLVIAGEGDFSKWLSASSPLWTRISFTGFLSKKNLRELYQIADIGIVPSRHEEFGYVAIEMMSYEIPLVVTDTTGLTEIIEDSVTGLKVPVRSPRKTSEKLAEKIGYLIENPDIRKRIGKNARIKFKACYGVKLFKEHMLALYNSL